MVKIFTLLVLIASIKSQVDESANDPGFWTEMEYMCSYGFCLYESYTCYGNDFTNNPTDCGNTVNELFDEVENYFDTTLEENQVACHSTMMDNWENYFDCYRDIIDTFTNGTPVNTVWDDANFTNWTDCFFQCVIDNKSNIFTLALWSLLLI